MKTAPSLSRCGLYPLSLSFFQMVNTLVGPPFE